MQVSIGATVFDLQRRPLVIAVLERPGRGPAGLERGCLMGMAKEAAGLGADLVICPAAAVTEGLPGALADIGVGCVGVATDPVEAEALVRRNVVAILWQGPGDRVDRGPVGSHSIPTFSRTGESLLPGDGVVVEPDELTELDRTPPGVVGIVDLSAIVGRAEIAALVAVALEAGASGFITSSPSAVRRAAHVIRAVEHAE
ncbi:MAG TPA: hypothetical protein VFN21_01845 [Acidimicrobiales bacterium]|nr:hypothetical protein [Acidimicrobiales bacterium]